MKTVVRSSNTERIILEFLYICYYFIHIKWSVGLVLENNAKTIRVSFCVHAAYKSFNCSHLAWCVHMSAASEEMTWCHSLCVIRKMSPHVFDWTRDNREAVEADSEGALLVGAGTANEVVITVNILFCHPPPFAWRQRGSSVSHCYLKLSSSPQEDSV